MSEETDMEDALWEALEQAMLARCKDKIPTVRVHAIAALARLQNPEEEDDIVTQALLYRLEHDLSADVRKSVLTNIGLSRTTLPAVIARTRDVREDVRRHTYTVLAARVDLRAFSLSQRAQLLSGYKNDRSPRVQAAVKEMLLNTWWPRCNGNALTFLENLDVVSHGVVALSAMEVLIQAQCFDIAGQLALSSDVLASAPAIVAHLTPERALAWLAALSKQPDQFCEASELVTCLQAVIAELSTPSSGDSSVTTRDNQFFVLKQLLLVVEVMDWSNEVARKAMLQVLTDFIRVHLSVLAEEELMKREEGLWKGIWQAVAHLMGATSPDYVRVALELFEAHTHSATAELEKEIAQCMAELSVIPLGAEEEKRATLIGQIQRMEAQLEGSAESDDSSHPQDALAPEVERNDLFWMTTLLACNAFLATLPHTSSAHQLSDLSPLYQQIVVEGMQQEAFFLRALAMESLTLLCLMDRVTAMGHVPLFLQVIQSDEAEVVAAASQGLFDLALLYGLQALEPMEAISGGSGEGEGGQRVKCRVQDCLLSLLQQPDPQVFAVAVQGWCKLLATDRIASEAVLLQLLTSYVSPTTADQVELRQFLSVFFSQQAPAHPQRFLRLLVPVLAVCWNAPSTSPLAMVDVEKVAHFMLSVWKVEEEPKEASELNRHGKGESRPHWWSSCQQQMAEQCMAELAQIASLSGKRNCAKILTLLDLKALDEISDRAMFYDLQEQIDLAQDAQLRRTLTKVQKGLRETGTSQKVGRRSGKMASTKNGGSMKENEENENENVQMDTGKKEVEEIVPTKRRLHARTNLAPL